MEKEIEDLLSEMKSQMMQWENRLNQLEKKIKPTETKNFVDLGLSVQWANVGAKYPEDYGNCYTFDEAQELSNSYWRVPTREEICELLENCDYKWTTQNGVNGGLFTSKINGNSIFLPAAGYRYGSGVYRVGFEGYYWSSSADDYTAYYLGFDSDGAYMGSGYYRDYYRDYGRSVRLVRGL